MRWKRVLGIAAAALVVMIVAIYIIVASYDFNQFKPRITEFVRQYTGRELTLGGDIDLGLSLVPTLVVNEVAFENAAWGSRPQMARIKRLEVQVELLPILRGNVHVSRVTIVNPEILIEIDQTGKSNLAFDIPAKSDVDASSAKSEPVRSDFLEVSQVRIEGGAVTFNDQQSGRTEALSIESLSLKSSGFDAPIEIDLSVNRNKIPFQISGNLGSIAAILNPQQQWPLNLTIAAVGSTFSVAGYITNIMEVKGINLKLDASGPDVAGMQKLTGKPLPIKGPFKVTGQLHGPTLENFKISAISILLGESRLSGEMTLDQKSTRPRIEAKFSSPKLDLRPFLNQNRGDIGDSRPTTAAGKSESQSDKVFSSKPFDLQALKLVDAVVDFQADQIFAQRLALDKFQLALSLKNGHLIVKPLTTNSGGGTFACDLDLMAKDDSAKLTAQITAEKIDLGQMLDKLGFTRDLDGVLEVAVNLNGQGNSMAALDGDVVAILKEGQMPVKYLNLVGADLTTSLLKIVNPLQKEIELAPINCAVCDFNIKDGLAQSDIIMIDDPDKTVLSAGTVNLKTEALDFGIEIQPKKGLGTQETGKVSVSLSAVTKPFKLGGTLANPSLGISPGRAAKTIASALVGPGGLASLFVTASSANQSPCVVALKEAGAGPVKSTATSGKDTDQEGTSEKKKGFGSRLKKVFD